MRDLNTLGVRHVGIRRGVTFDLGVYTSGLRCTDALCPLLFTGASNLVRITSDNERRSSRSLMCSLTSTSGPTIKTEEANRGESWNHIIRLERLEPNEKTLHSLSESRTYNERLPSLVKETVFMTLKIWKWVVDWCRLRSFVRPRRRRISGVY